MCANREKRVSLGGQQYFLLSPWMTCEGCVWIYSDVVMLNVNMFGLIMVDTIFSNGFGAEWVRE